MFAGATNLTQRLKLLPDEQPAMTESNETPAGKKRFARNVFWNLLGTGLPMLVAVVAVPALVHGMGAARFGVLSLAWMVVGYFSLFDLGLGRAMTQLVAQKLGRGEEAQIPSLVWAAMALMGALGLLGALTISGVAPLLVGRVLKIPPDLRAETLAAFYLLALSIPVVIGTTGLRGILEAHQRFGIVNLVRVPLGLITYLGPLAVLPFSHSLPAMVLVLLLARIVSFVVYLGICLNLFPELRRRKPVESTVLRQLLSYGGWMTLSNVAAPLLLYLGRIVVAAMISAEAVAYFSTPYDVVINLLVIPTVFLSVLFPTFAKQFQTESAAVGRLYRRSLLQVGLLLLLPVLLICLFAREGLAWWINEEFSRNGFRVAQMLAIGVFINSFGHISQAVIQAYGRPDLTAKLHVAELVAYVPYMWWLIAGYGIEGAAAAWVIRVTISTIVLGVLARSCIAGAVGKRY